MPVIGLQQCPNCAAPRARLRLTRVDRVRDVAGLHFVAPLFAQKCTKCKTVFHDAKQLQHFDLLVALQLANEGVTVPEAVRFMRAATGLNAKTFAKLLDVRPETVSRWETGARPIDRATLAVFRQLLVDKLGEKMDTADFLRSLDRPHPRRKTIRLELPAAA